MGRYMTRILAATLAALLIAVSPSPSEATDYYFRYKHRLMGGEGISLSASGSTSGRVGFPLSAYFNGIGGSGSYDYTYSGTLPAGMAASGNSILGTPSAVGTYPLTVTVEDRGNASLKASIPVTFKISPPVSLAGPSSVEVRVGEPVLSSFVATGIIGSVSWGLTGPSLPAGLTFDGGGRIVGTPTAPGNVTVAVKATDTHDGASDQVSVGVNVGPDLAIGTPPSLVGRTGTAIPSHNFSATGLIGSGTWSQTGIPQGLSLSASGTLSGTPVTSVSGAFDVTLTDVADGAKDTVNVPYAFAEAPAITLAQTAYTLHVSETLAIRPLVTGILGNQSWDLAAGSLPSWMQIDSASGAVTGAPTGIGTHSGISIRVTDSADGAQATSQAFSVAVVDHLIVSGVPDHVRMRVGASPLDESLGWFTARAPGAVGEVTWSLSGAIPAGSSLAIGTDGKVTGTVVTDGAFTVTVTATSTTVDAQGDTVPSTATKDVSFDVRPPLAVAALPETEYTGTVGADLVLPAPSTTGKVGTVTYRAEGPSLPPGMTILANTGEITGKPTGPSAPATYCIHATDSWDGASACSPPFTLSTSNPPAEPHEFVMTDVSGVQLNTVALSSWVGIAAIDTAQVLSVAGEGNPELRWIRGSSVSGWAKSHTVAAGYGFTFQVRATSAAAPLETRTVSVTVGSTTKPWNITTREPDEVPSAFSIAAVKDAALSTTVKAVFLTSGYDAAVPISISGGEISLDAAVTWTTTGSVEPNKAVWVRTTSSGEYATEKVATVVLGGVTGTWIVTTKAEAKSPNTFYVPAARDLMPNTLAVSSPVSVTGDFVTLPISVTGDGNPSISVAGGPWTTSATITNGESFTVRATASGSYGTGIYPTVKIGTSNRAWTVATASLPTVSISNVTGAAFSTLTERSGTVRGTFSTTLSVSGNGNPQVSVDNGATWSTSVPVNLTSTGIPFKVRLTSSASPLTTHTAAIALGPTTHNWTVITRGNDYTPNAFTVTWPATVPNIVLPSTEYVSNAVTVAGFDGPLPLTASGAGDPEVSLDGTVWGTSVDIMPGQSFRLRLTTSPQYSTAVTPTVALGTAVAGGTGRTTHAAPNFGSYPANATNVQPSSVNDASFTASPSGASVTVSVSGEGDPYLSVDNKATWAKSVPTTGGTTIYVRNTASDQFSTTLSAVISIGTATRTWTVATRVRDTAPNSFAFTWATTSRNPGETILSNPITLGGFDGPVTLTTATKIGTPVPEVSVNGGPWDTSFEVMPGDVFRLRMTLSMVFGENVQATVTAGSLGAITATLTTRSADTTPDAFEVGADVRNVAAGTVFQTPITPTGFDGVLPVSITWGGNYANNPVIPPDFSLDGGLTWVTSGNISAGQTVIFRYRMTDYTTNPYFIQYNFNIGTAVDWKTLHPN